MKKFMAVYIGSQTSEKMKNWEALGEQAQQEREKEGINAWKNWGKKNEKSILEGGSPLGTTIRVDATGISKTKNNLCAYVVVEANSHEEAAKLFIGHPHFTVFPGDAVEVMECFPVPEN